MTSAWSAPVSRILTSAGAGMLLAVVAVADVSAQVHWRDLVVTMGGSVERYTGNFSAVTVPLVDSTDHATAAVGELGVRGALALFERDAYDLVLSVDGGIRQAAAVGFAVRDYAPREWAGSSVLRLRRSVGAFGSVFTAAGVTTRSVEDRPPMPLFLQPGYTSVFGSGRLETRAFDGVSFDVGADVETADYRALEFVPQLNLLDRRGVGVEAGARWLVEGSSIRFYGGVRWSEYEHQGSFDPSDPFRRDRTVRAGLGWTYGGKIFVQAGLEGAINRSNSNRPEYDALSASAIVTVPLPAELTLNAYALLTGKSYVHETDFARLVPGEEADNASIAYLDISRALAVNLDGAIRVGWTRAETDIADAYYQRFGLSVRLNYRPQAR